MDEWEEIKSVIEINAVNGLYLNGTAFVGDEAADEIKRDLKILILGCRNSEISKFMYDDGYKTITNVDAFPDLIDAMQLKFGTSVPEIKWINMNPNEKLHFDDHTFDLIIDKNDVDANMRSGS